MGNGQTAPGNESIAVSVVLRGRLAVTMTGVLQGTEVTNMKIMWDGDDDAYDIAKTFLPFMQGKLEGTVERLLGDGTRSLPRTYKEGEDVSEDDDLPF
jgi:hypothetical protein